MDYDRRLLWENRTVLATDHQFLVPFGRHELTGTVDLVELSRNHKGKDPTTEQTPGESVPDEGFEPPSC